MLGKVEVGNFGDPKIHFPKTGYLWIYIPRKMIRNKFEAPKYKTSIHQGIYYSRFVTRSSPPFISTDTPFSLPKEFLQHKTHLELFVEGTPNPNAFVQHLGANQSSGNRTRQGSTRGCHWGLQTLIALHGLKFQEAPWLLETWKANSSKKLQQCVTFRSLKPKKTYKCERNTSTHSYRWPRY